MVRTFVAAVLLVAIVLGAMVTPQWYMTDYGYFVPHWTYQGWGGPIYWSRLTFNEDNHMDMYVLRPFIRVAAQIQERYVDLAS